MRKILLINIGFTVLFSSCLYAVNENRNRVHSVNKAIQKITKVKEKEPSIVEKLHSVVKDGKVIGQFRTLYSGFENKNSVNNYATAVGGMLKYETAQYHGVSAAAAMVTTNDIRALSGENQKYNEELSGTSRSYTQLSEAYLNYSYKTLELRAGRQIIDTPLADSDDIRMVGNSFEAYTAQYLYNHWNFMFGHLQRWQGNDAGLDKGWVKTGKNGSQYMGISFSNKVLDISAWYYNFSNPSVEDIAQGDDKVANRSFYTDISAHINVKKELFLHFNGQYLKQKELDNSQIAADIYGVMGEIVYNKLGLRLAYNSSNKKSAKQSFSGYGGGTLFTSMDSMILDEITADRKADAIMAAVSYYYKRLKFLYAYGDFKGEADTSGVKAHIIEQNIAAKYKYNKALTIGAIYVIERNKEYSQSLEFNNDNFRLLFAYNF
ncbi:MULTISPECIES: hypothetical protein [Sulfurimonas]|uniref:hypothetical protein n=1 Tax=Sulfurimonas TaxID=202746 RepID=UPI00126431A0|nr:hypothetical protein [Sulfurimonas indica]